MTISDCAFATCNVHNAITHITGGVYTCYGVISGVRVGFFRDNRDYRDYRDVETTETAETQRKMIPDFVVVSFVSLVSKLSLAPLGANYSFYYPLARASERTTLLPSFQLNCGRRPTPKHPQNKEGLTPMVNPSYLTIALRHKTLTMR